MFNTIYNYLNERGFEKKKTYFKNGSIFYIDYFMEIGDDLIEVSDQRLSDIVVLHNGKVIYKKIRYWKNFNYSETINVIDKLIDKVNRKNKLNKILNNR